MKRLVLSLLGGILIPVAYTAIIVTLSFYIESRRINELLSLPIRWPIILFIRLVPWDSPLFRDEYINVLAICTIPLNVMLYAALTYALLWRFGKRKQLQPPPPQPDPFSAD